MFETSASLSTLKLEPNRCKIHISWKCAALVIMSHKNVTPAPLVFHPYKFHRIERQTSLDRALHYILNIQSCTQCLGWYYCKVRMWPLTEPFADDHSCFKARTGLLSSWALKLLRHCPHGAFVYLIYIPIYLTMFSKCLARIPIMTWSYLIARLLMVTPVTSVLLSNRGLFGTCWFSY
jgi:hypothetical protein